MFSQQTTTKKEQPLHKLYIAYDLGSKNVYRVIDITITLLIDKNQMCSCGIREHFAYPCHVSMLNHKVPVFYVEVMKTSNL